MDEALTVPCEGIGVWEGARVITPVDGEGIVTDVSPDHEYGITVSFGRGDRRPLGYLRRDLRIDLTHRMTRLEVMARLAERWGLTAGSPYLGVLGRGWQIGEGAWGRWLLPTDPGSPVASGGLADGRCSAIVVIPTLANLDPTDDTRLPDGARVVDVRALAIVLRHVFRGAVP